MIRKQKLTIWGVFKTLLTRFMVVVGAVGLTLTFFLVLPLMQTLTKPPSTDLFVTSVDTGDVDPPPPPPEEEPEEEPEQEEKPPELTEETQPLSLSQLEIALNPGFGDGFGYGEMTVQLNKVTSGGKDVDALFSIADLDQQPRAIYQPGPTMTSALKKKAPGTVYIIFIVDKRGRVVSPKIERSSDPVFNNPALSAIKKWKFEPGKRNGQPVQSRMRLPMTFTKG